MWFENLKIALGELKANPFRSALTTLGIVIAVGAVIAVVSIVQGASHFMLEKFEGFGANAVWVWRKRPPGVEGRKMGRIKLTYDDAKAIAARCPAVKAVSPFVGRSAILSYRAEEHSVRVRATTPAWQQTGNWYPDVGRFFTPTELETRAPVIVLGTEIVTKLNSAPDRILGKEIKVNGNPFRVIGVLEKKGAMLGDNQDEIAVIPITTGFRLFGQRQRDRVVISAQAKTAGQTQAAVDQIRWLLRLRHNRKRGEADDFGVFTSDQFLKEFKKVSLMVTGLLVGIVSVALLVGGIGIMNIMLVSVSERTREIGIRKALGAKNRDVLSQFLIEAVALGALGGIVGIALGTLAGLFTREAISVFVDFPPIHVPFWAVGIALGFSGSVGLVSGLYPAWKAARLDPIEALRHD